MLLDIFDPKAPPRAVGIDLGTTQSVAAFVREGRPDTVVTCDGTPLLPSVVHYGPRGDVLVGRGAVSRQGESPEATIASVKRFMGRSSTDPQTRALGSYRFAPAETPEQARVVRFDVGGGQVKSPVEVSAEILRSLKRSAEEQLRTVGGAVITVPAYFDEAQRQATKDAASLAGLSVLRLLNEPTAAAVAYGLQQGTAGNYAVYDLGGGTFDVTILELSDGVFHVKSTGGDSALGGDDMDRALAQRMLDQLGFGPNPGRALVSQALRQARAAKHALTGSESTEVALPGPGGAEQTLRISRSELDSLIEPLLERTGRVCRRALRDAGYEPSELSGVILVGGSTRVPRVQSYVTKLFGHEPLCSIDPELVVAHGAALQAEQLAAGSAETLLLDVLPLSLGIETMGGAVDKILPRNTTIPVGATATFTTYADNQTGFDLHVVQGERELASDCRSLARFTLKGIPPLPAGQARLEVSFVVDENSLLAVKARELSTGIEQRVEVSPTHGLTDEEVEEMLMQALDEGEADFEARRRVESSVEAGRVMEATRKALSADADLLSTSERTEIEQALSALATAVEEKASGSNLTRRLQSLDDATQAFAGRRMDRAFQAALSGQRVAQVENEVEDALGVDAHVEAHARRHSP